MSTYLRQQRKAAALEKIRKKFKKPMRTRKTVLVNRALAPIAQRYITKLKYAESTLVTSIAGAATYVFNLNSIFDPNRTGIGHQPYGHDSLELLYNRYRVTSCSFAISAIDTNGKYIQVAAIPSNELLSVSSISQVVENPRARYITQAPNAALKTLKGTVSIPSLVGRTKSQYMADDRYQATFGNSPSELALLTFVAQTLSGANDNMSIAFNITLVYNVEVFDVKNLPQS